VKSVAICDPDHNFTTMNLRISATALLSLSTVSNGLKILSEHCSTIKADFARRQLAEWNSSAAFTSADGTANIPVLTVSDDGSSFTVDIEGATQVPSDDPEVVHFVTHVYVEDQVCVFGCAFDGIAILTLVKMLFCTHNAGWKCC
jgi:hypothetical protein